MSAYMMQEPIPQAVRSLHHSLADSTNAVLEAAPPSSLPGSIEKHV